MKYDHATTLLRDVLNWFPVLFESSLRSVYWSTSRFMGLRLGICTTTVRRPIHPLRCYDFDRRDLLVRQMKSSLVTAPSHLLAPDAGTDFLLT